MYIQCKVRRHVMGRYDELFQRSIKDPEGFWGDAAQAITWDRKWDKVLDDSNKPFYRWFTGGEMNTCFNALDRHVEGRQGGPGGDHLRQPGDEHDPEVSPTGNCSIRSPASPARSTDLGVTEGRHGHHLHADDPAGRHRHARLRAPGGGPFRGLRRIRAP